MEIIIVRHGESVNNQPDPSLHTLDPDLTPRGLLQAQLVGERFEGVQFDALLSSPCRRALRTANEISVRKGDMPIHILHEMVEVGTEYAVLKHADALKICPNALPYGETSGVGDYGDNYGLDFREAYYNIGRAYRVISRVRQMFSQDSTVVLVAHGAFNQRLIAAALRTAFPPDFIFSQENTGVSVISDRPDREGRMITRLVMMNDTSHLYYGMIRGLDCLDASTPFYPYPGLAEK